MPGKSTQEITVREVQEIEPRNGEQMDYFHPLWGRSWRGAWNTVSGAPLQSILIGLCSTAMSAAATAKLIGADEMKEMLISAGIGVCVTGLLFVAIVVVNLVVVTPRRMFLEERSRAKTAQDKLDDYDETPVFPIIELPSNSAPIRVNIINKGKEEEPIESVCLYLCDSEKNEPFRILKPEPDNKTLPLTMPRKTNLRVAFDICGAHCIQWHVKSIFAVVSLQDGRKREGDHYTIRQEDPPFDVLLVAYVPHAQGRTWEQSMVRHKRIHKVARAYRLACDRDTRGMAVNRLRDLNEAPICDLEDASEVHELLMIFNANGVQHPFVNGENADSILRFYKDNIPKGRSIGGIQEWTMAYTNWFGEITPLLPVPDTEAPPQSPTS